MKKLLMEEVHRLFREIPQLVTDEVATSFVVDLIDFHMVDKDWLALTSLEKYQVIHETLNDLETQGILTSQSRFPKRTFVSTGDDEQVPNLPNRVRFFKLKR